jgi:hypothetical protein
MAISVIFTDQWGAYSDLEKMGYQHSRINHSEKVYRYLQKYLDEYAFRYNNRETPGGMFEAFLGRIQKTPSLGSLAPKGGEAKCAVLTRGFGPSIAGG